MLDGGNMNAVRRVGSSVHRVAGPWTPTVHRYLRYVADHGIDWAPEPRGIVGDEEVLSFLEGEVPVYPLPAWVWADSVLVDGATRLRKLHDASIGFALDDAVWQSPANAPIEVICHNDFAPHNLAFEGGEIIGAIDFDMCSPGPRLWDLAYFATRVVPLTSEIPDGAPASSDARRRVQLILDAYGSDETWDDLLRVAIGRLWDLAAFSIAKSEELGKPKLLADANGYERDADYLAGLLTSP
jgi:hypothetical protein